MPAVRPTVGMAPEPVPERNNSSVQPKGPAHKFAEPVSVLTEPEKKKTAGKEPEPMVPAQTALEMRTAAG